MPTHSPGLVPSLDHLTNPFPRNSTDLHDTAFSHRFIAGFQSCRTPNLQDVNGLLDVAEYLGCMLVPLFYQVLDPTTSTDLVPGAVAPWGGSIAGCAKQRQGTLPNSRRLWLTGFNRDGMTESLVIN